MVAGDDYQLVFEFRSDPAYSDEDGLHATAAGGFAVDDLTIDDLATVLTYDFETDDEGFTAHAQPTDGTIADITNVWAAEPVCFDVATPHGIGSAALAGSIPQGHGEYFVSPPVDISSFGSNPHLLGETRFSADLPCLDGVRFAVGWSYYPESCSGVLRWSQLRFRTYFYTSAPTCDVFQEMDRFPGVDMVPAGADSARMVIYVTQSCDFAAGCPGECTGVTNDTPYFDDIRIGVVSERVRLVPTLLYPTIQAAIDSAAVGDTVLVAEGTYTGVGNKDIDFGGKDLVLLAQGTGAVIDCEGSGRGFRMEGGETAAAVIDRFTIRNGAPASGRGGGIAILSSSPTIRNCVVEDCATSSPADGGGISVFSLCSPVIESCVIQNNSSTDQAGGIWASDGATPTIIDCQIINNTATVAGGGLGLRDSGTIATVTRCTITGNSTQGRGAGAYFSQSAGSFTDCVIQGNTASEHGGGVYATGSATFVTMSGCLLTGNHAAELGGGFYQTSSPTCSIVASTLAGNHAGTNGGGIRAFSGTLTVDRSIVWGNCASGGPGDEIYTGASAIVDFLCSDVDSTAVDNPGTVTYDANTVALDPEFCGPEDCLSAPTTAGDYALTLGSVCNPLYSPCGEQIGALAGTCLGPSPALTAVADVPDDQGRQVRLTWTRTVHDGPAGPTITEYGIWRRIDSWLALGGPETRSAGTERRSDVLLPPGSWDFVGTVPARGDDEYHTVAPTLCDSTETELCTSTFFVSAMTADPLTFFDSMPLTGYSVDNLPPGVPTGLMLVGTDLAWDAASDSDFAYHSVYGSMSAEFDPAATLIGYTIDPSYDVAGASYGFYHVTTTDHAGNEGEAASVEGALLSSPEAPAATTYTLFPPGPNPFRSGTALTFALPVAGDVRLVIYDASGRVVRTLADGAYAPAVHRVAWDARDDGGRPVGPGAYFARLTAGTYEAERRLTVIR